MMRAPKQSDSPSGYCREVYPLRERRVRPRKAVEVVDERRQVVVALPPREAEIDPTGFGEGCVI